MNRDQPDDHAAAAGRSPKADSGAEPGRPGSAEHAKGHSSIDAEGEQGKSSNPASVSDSFFSIDGGASRGVEDRDAGMVESIGDYELIDTLGEGGMGVVYLARQRSAGRLVALKVIRPDRLGSLRPDQRRHVVERFQTEARAAAQLDHDNIVTIYDVGEHDGRQFFSMRYVDGNTLADRLATGPIENRQSAIYIQQVCLAVDVAHQRGVLHRDLKPQNILIDSGTDRALVADFGLAKLTQEEEALTRDGDVMGTPQYMSPEQAQDSAGVNAQSDVYALGATLYHMLTGRPVFQAATVWDTLRQVIDEPPVPPRQLNPAVHLDLDTICLKCLEKDPQRRFESSRELAEELQRYIDGQPIHSRPIGPVGRLTRWSRRNPLLSASAFTALFCLVGILATVSVALVKTRDAYQRSEESFKQALNAVNDFFTTVSEETLLDQPGLKPLRQDLMRQALVYYERFS